MELSLHELQDFAKKLVAELPTYPGPHAHVLGLRGELGAGKTTLAQLIARELGVTEPVTSPTFTLVQVYPILRAPFTRFVHIDAYRLDPEDSDTIGWEEYVRDPSNFIVVEWPENLHGFPEDAATITLTVKDENSRHVSYNAQS